MAGKQVALLRGINVGRAKRVAMADLRALVEGLGYGNVRTLLNSGNIVFTRSRTAPGDAAGRIEQAVAEQLGISARVTVLSAADFSVVVRDNPLLEVADDPSRLLVAFLARSADLLRLKPLVAKDWSPERLATGARVAYLWCPEGILASRVNEAVSRALEDGVTTRSWATVKKLHALLEEGP